MSLLELLGTVLTPDLTPSEVLRVRSILGAQRPAEGRPWESGLIDRPARAPTEVEELRARVAELELAVKVLGDLLVQSGVLQEGAFAARVAAVRGQLAAERAAQDESERAARQAAAEARRARTVTCAACGAVVRERDSFLSAAGPRCSACHQGTRSADRVVDAGMVPWLGRAGIAEVRGTMERVGCAA